MIKKGSILVINPSREFITSGINYAMLNLNDSLDDKIRCIQGKRNWLHVVFFRQTRSLKESQKHILNTLVFFILMVFAVTVFANKRMIMHVISFIAKI